MTMRLLTFVRPDQRNFVALDDLRKAARVLESLRNRCHPIGGTRWHRLNSAATELREILGEWKDDR